MAQGLIMPFASVILACMLAANVAPPLGVASLTPPERKRLARFARCLSPSGPPALVERRTQARHASQPYQVRGGRNVRTGQPP